MALNQDTTVGLPYNTGGTLALADSSTVADGVFVIDVAGEKWERVFDGGNSVYRASWLFNTGAATNKQSLVAIALANANVKRLEIDVPIEINGAINANGKTIERRAGGVISGTYAISNANFEGSLTQQILTPTGTLTNCKSNTGKWHPAWFGATGDGSTNDYASINFALGVANTNSQKDVLLSPGNYNSGSNISVPAGVNLEFSVGAYISGSITVSGAGTFEAKPTLAFASGVTVSGLYPIYGKINPLVFGAVGNDTTNDSPAFQRMWNYIATLTTNTVSIFIPPKNYYLPETVFLPKTGVAVNKYIYMSGYGAQLRTDTNNPIFSRHPLTTGEATVCLDAYKLTVEGILFLGNSTLVADQTNQIGLDFGATYSWVINDCYFYRLYKGVEAQFWLNGKITNCHFTQNYYCDIMGRYGDWPGASRTNSAFNSNTIFGCRFVSRNTSFTTVYLLSADQTLIQECISEGLNPLYNFYMDFEGSTAVNINTYQNIWLESVGGVNAQNTNFYLKMGGEVHLNNIQREYSNRFFEVAADSAGALSLIVDGSAYFSSVPSSGLTFFSRNGVNNGDWKFIFKNIYTGMVGGLQVPEVAANWDGGTIPTSVSIDTYAPVGGGITAGIRKSTVTEIIAAANVVFKNTAKPGVGYRGLYINAPQTVNGSASASSLLIGNTDLSAPTLPAASIVGSQRHILWFGQNTSANAGTQQAIAYVGNTTDNGRTAISSLITARGTLTTPTAVANTVVLGINRYEGFDGTAFVISAFIKAIVDGTVSTGIVPTLIEFQVMNSSGTIQAALRIRASGQIELPVAPASGTTSDSILVRDSGGELKTIAYPSGAITSSPYTMSSARILGRTTASSGPIEEITIGSGLSMASGTLSASASAPALSDLLAATANKTLDNTNFIQEWQWSTLAGNSGLILSSASTAAASNLQKILQVLQTGANATSTQTTYAAHFSNTKTGTSSTNIALLLSASGGTVNTALHATNRIVQEFDGDMVLTGTNANLLKGISFQNATSLERAFLKSNMGTGQVSLGVGAGGFFLTLMENGVENARMTGNKFGWGVTVPTAVMHIKAGTATANTAPLKFTAGTILTVAESGVLETDGGNNLFYTNTTAVRGRLQQNRTLTSGAGSLAISDNYNHYVFTGTTSTWTLPAVSGTANVIYYIKNRGSGVLTINTTSGNEIYETAAVATINVSAGAALVLFSDGTYYNVE